MHLDTAVNPAAAGGLAADGGRGLVLAEGRPEEAVETLAEALLWPQSDPFATETVCAESPGMSRWLAARLGERLGAAGNADGVCAGIDFPTLAQFTERTVDDLAGIDRRADPWSRSRFTATVFARLRAAKGEPWFELVHHHLGDPEDEERPGRWFHLAARFAGLLRRYWTHRPGMLREWLTGQGEDLPEESAWQPELWRRLCDAVPVPDPLTRFDTALGEIAGTERSRLFVFGLDEVTPRTRDFLTAFSEHRPVQVFRFGPARDGHRIAARLGMQGSASRDALRTVAAAVPSTRRSHSSPVVPSPADTVLRRLQSDVMAGRSNTFHPGADDSIQFHLSHGPARQAEVLRETLTGLFADDSTLEPRDVVVLCPDVAAVAPHVRGLLCAPAEAGLTHPGHSLRVQVVASGSAANPLLDTLLRLIDVLGGRVTLAQLGAIAAEPAVARKFGISTDAHAELFELLAAAGVRWGLDAADRARFGLDGMDRLTVAAGLDRLLLGVALDDDAIPIVGGVLPQDGVESSSIADVGRLAELVSRLTTFAHELRRPATPADWVVRLRDAALRLFEPHPNESWQLGALMNVIATVGELDSGHAPPAPQGGVVALGDVRAILAAALRDQPVRNSLGNGSLSVTTPAAARSVPHRVVCLVGIDDETFPRNRRIDGDDLSAGEHEPLDEDPHRADRQLLLDAVLAARDRLIVIGQHRDPVSNAHVPLALPLVELQEGAGITETGDSPLRIVEHPPVAFSPTVFATPAGSFDTALIPAATPVVREPPPDPFRFGELPPVTPGVVTIGTLIRFFRHPLRELLGVRCGLPTFTPEAVSSELPIEPDGLARWKVAGRMLATWQAGHDLARAAAAERARGELPAGRLGDDVLHRATGTVEHIATQLEDLAPGARQVHEAVVAVGEWTVTGTLDVVGHELRTVTVSNPKADKTLEPWLHLLLLQTARPEVPWTSRLVSPKGTRSWQVPTAQARHFLSWLVSIYELGLTMPLPLPPETSFDYARMANDGRLDDTQLRHAYRGEVQRDRWWSQVYPTLDSLEAVPRPEGLALPEGERSFFGTLARAVWTPSQRWEAV